MTNEQEYFQTPATPGGPRSFIARHWIALLCVVVFIILMVFFIRYIHNKQPVAQPGRGGRSREQQGTEGRPDERVGDLLGRPHPAVGALQLVRGDDRRHDDDVEGIVTGHHGVIAGLVPATRQERYRAHLSEMAADHAA